MQFGAAAKEDGTGGGKAGENKLHYGSWRGDHDSRDGKDNTKKYSEGERVGNAASHAISELGSVARRRPQSLYAHTISHICGLNPTGHLMGHPLQEVFVQDAAATNAPQART